MSRASGWSLPFLQADSLTRRVSKGFGRRRDRVVVPAGTGYCPRPSGWYYVQAQIRVTRDGLTLAVPRQQDPQSCAKVWYEQHHLHRRPNRYHHRCLVVLRIALDAVQASSTAKRGSNTSGFGERQANRTAVQSATKPSMRSQLRALSSFRAPVGSTSTTTFQQFHVSTGMLKLPIEDRRLETVDRRSVSAGFLAAGFLAKCKLATP